MDSPDTLISHLMELRDRLLRANLHNSTEILEEVSRLLTDLRGAWAQIKPETSAEAGSGSGTANIRA